MENGESLRPAIHNLQPSVIDLTSIDNRAEQTPAVVGTDQLNSAVGLSDGTPLAEQVSGDQEDHESSVKEEIADADDNSENNSNWEDESLFEEHINEITDNDYSSVSTVDCCSLQEAKHLRSLLRSVGWQRFIQSTLLSERYSAKKLCTAFGVALTEELRSLSEDKFVPLLGALMQRALAKRERLEQFSTPDSAAKLLRESQNIVVITGAGISTNLGIPDFRSKGTGLYSRLVHLGLDDPQDAFSLELFQHSPDIFYTVARDIYPSTKRFSPTHAFIRLLQDKGKLLTNFTQNIDNLEEAAGIADDRLIQCHGSWRRATCQQCGYNTPGSIIEADLKEGKVARCKACIQDMELEEATGGKRKRSHSSKPKKKRREDFEDSSTDEDQYTIREPGVMKPDITFFGEDLPDKFHKRLLEHDKDKVDLCLVIGTSLKVSPVADIPDFFPPHVPQIYISRDPVNHVQFDVELLGDCDEIVTGLCRRAGWELKHEMVKNGTTVKENNHENAAWRWDMRAEEGGIIASKDIDEGTLGHGESLMPADTKGME